MDVEKCAVLYNTASNAIRSNDISVNVCNKMSHLNIISKTVDSFFDCYFAHVALVLPAFHSQKFFKFDLF